MPEKRVRVWCQRFADRPHLMLQWLDPDTGRRKSQSAKTDDPKKAEEARGDLESDLNNDRYAEPSRLSWRVFRQQFEEEYVAGTRKNTQLNFKATLDVFEKVCSPRNLRSISERTISAFVAGMHKLPCRGRIGMMPSTIKVRLEFLHTALMWGFKQTLITQVPNFPDVKVPKKRPQPIPAESFDKLLEKAKDANMRAYLLTGWLAGLRLSEAALLEWQESSEAPWVDFGRNRIILPADVAKSAEDQWVPVDPVLRQTLLALPRQGRRVFRFVDQHGRRISMSAVSDRVGVLAKKAGVKLTMHSLRKGFGCRHAGRLPAQVLQRLMRHSAIKTTMDYYANIDDAVEEAILGPQCNSLCNSTIPTGTATISPIDATHL